MSEEIFLTQEDDGAWLLSSYGRCESNALGGGSVVPGTLTLSKQKITFNPRKGDSTAIEIVDIIQFYVGIFGMNHNDSIVIVYRNQGELKNVEYNVEDPKKWIREMETLGIEVYGNDNLEEKQKVKKIKEKSLHFFMNEMGDYLAIYSDHLEMKVYKKSLKFGTAAYPFGCTIDSTPYTYISFDGLMTSYSEDGGSAELPHIHFGQNGTWNKNDIIWFYPWNGAKWENVENLILETKTNHEKIKISQKVVHGDEITKTEIKDSVVSKSRIGGGSSKMQELKELSAMKKEGLITDEEFEKMKRNIIG